MIPFLIFSSIKINFNNDISFLKISDYDLIFIKDCGFYSIPGYPVIPIKTLSYNLTGNKSIKGIKIIKEEWEELFGFFKLFPGQNPFPLSLEVYDFIKPDSMIYNSEKQYPENNIILSGEGIKRGEKIIGVVIFPLRYIPKEGKVFILKSIEFEIKEEECYDFFDFHMKRKKEDRIEYIIITKNEFVPYFYPLKKWKTKKGVKTEIFNVDSIIQNFQGNTKQEKIRNFIKWAYTNLGTDYVLLGGQADYENNQEIIPRMDLFYKSSGVSGSPYDKDTIPSDIYYSNLDGNWNFDGDNIFGEVEDSVDLYADVYVGRAPCKDTNDVKIFVNKVINYERNPSIEHLENIMLPAELLFPFYNYWGDSVNNFISKITPNNINDIKLYQSNGNYSGIIVKNTIESGVGFAHYASHGNAYGTAGITIRDIDNLKNGVKIGLHTGISCLTGALDYVEEGDCFAEHIVLNPNGGGIASIMNTRYGWGYIPGLGPSETIDTTIFSLIYVNNVLNLGKLNSLSKEPYVPVVQIEGLRGYYRWCIYELMLFGDPEMPLWRKIPDSIFPEFKKVLSYNDTIFEVFVKDRYGNPLNNMKICLMKDDIYKVKETDNQGYVLFNIGSHSPGFMNITITNADFLPFEDSVYLAENICVNISPDSVPVNFSSDVIISILDESGYSIPGIEVQISGQELMMFDTTDETGKARFDYLYPIYGEFLKIKGRKIKENLTILQDSLKVYGAEDLQNYFIFKGSEIINLNGYLMKNIPCEIKTFTEPQGHKVFLSGCGIDTIVEGETDTLKISIIPLKDGIIKIKVCKEGFNIVHNYSVVKDFRGAVSGAIYDLFSGKKIDAKISFYGSDTIFCKPINGNFSGDTITCGYYYLNATSFGFYDLETLVVVKFPENFYEIIMKPTPKSFISGYVIDKRNEKGLFANIDIYASDSLILSTQTDLKGYFSFELPFFNYNFKVKSKGYKMKDTIISICNEITNLNFNLDTAIGRILIVKDDTIGESPKLFNDLLLKMGYYSEIINADSASKLSWEKYDIIIISSGRNSKPLKYKELREKIRLWCENMHKIIIEGGDVGYYYSWNDFGKKVLHIRDWKGNNGGRLVLVGKNHPIVKYPNILPEKLNLDYKGEADQDICVIKPEGDLIYGNEKYPECSGLLVYDNTPQLESGQLVYFGFNFERLEDDIRCKLLENTITYLYAKESYENAKIRIFSDPKGTEDNSVLIKVFWKGKLYKTDTTNELGEKNLNLFEGKYDILFSKQNYSDTLVKDIQINNNENIFLLINLYPFIRLYSSDFEFNTGSLIPSGDWEWGEVSYGPECGASGVKVWGTNLDSSYTKNSDSRLETQSIFLPKGKNIKFLFNMWFHSDSFYDGGNVKVSKNNDGFSVIDPVYPVYNIERMSSQNRGIPKERGWTGNMTEWKRVEFDLSKFAGDTVKIRWHFGSNYIIEYPGWFIDDVIVGYTDYEIGDDEEKTIINIPTVFKDKIVLSIYSNIPSIYEIYIYDILGRLVSKLNGDIFLGTNKIEVSINKQGIYFLKTIVNNKINQKKVILIR